MTDLFTPPPRPGESNGRFLALVANGVPAAELRRRHREGEFPELHPEIAKLMEKQP